MTILCSNLNRIGLDWVDFQFISAVFSLLFRQSALCGKTEHHLCVLRRIFAFVIVIVIKEKGPADNHMCFSMYYTA